MQGSNPGLLHCRQIPYHLNHQGSLKAAYFNTFRAEIHSNLNTNTSCLALCIPFSQLLLLLLPSLLSSSKQKIQRFLHSARAGAQVHQRRSFSYRVPPSTRAEDEMARVQNHCRKPLELQPRGLLPSVGASQEHVQPWPPRWGRANEEQGAVGWGRPGPRAPSPGLRPLKGGGVEGDAETRWGEAWELLCFSYRLLPCPFLT